MAAVTVVETNGLPVVNVPTAPPQTVSAVGVPVMVVSTNGRPMNLINPDGTQWTP